MLLRKALLLFLSIGLCATLVQAQDKGEAGEGSVGFRLGFYNNEDSGDGNPFLDEALTVVEPIIVFDYNVNDKSTVWGQFSYDYVSSASIDRLNKFPDQSGATGDYYFGLDLGWRKWTSETTQRGLFTHFSTEYDYFSVGVGGDLSKELTDRNARAKLSLNLFYDSIDIIRFDGTEDEGTDDRISAASTFNWYQIVTPDRHAEMGVTLGHQTGFLETPYNAVVIEGGSMPNPNLDNNAAGTEITEELPDNRSRIALFGKVRQYINPQSSVELGGRLYTDTWGISSVTLEPRYYRWLVEDDLKLRLRYRFYMQTEADDYEEHFFAETSERTQDSDLADFNANMLGFQFEWFFRNETQADFGLDYIVRSDGLNQVLATMGWKRKF